MSALLRKVVPTIATILAVFAFIAAGNWQRDRMHAKDEAGRQLAAASAAPPVALPREVTDWTPWRYRRVIVEGRYDAARQILIDNRVHRGRFGYHVVTPLVLRDGRAVLVNRGFVPGGPSREVLPDAPPPLGEIRLQGRINLPSSRPVEPKPERGVWPYLDPTRYTSATGLAVLPVVIEQQSGASDALARDWPDPDFASAKHLGYMLQWYAFAALAIGLWGFFTFRRRA